MSAAHASGWSGAVPPIDGCRPDGSASARSRLGGGHVRPEAADAGVLSPAPEERRDLRLRVKLRSLRFFHQLSELLDSNVQQEADVRDRQSGDLGDLAITQFVLKLQPDNFLLVAG
jgi:hypothetical protein